MKLSLKKKETEILIEEITIQGNTHPDPSLREFYFASLDVYREDKTFKNVLDRVMLKRTDIPAKHFVNLLYRAVQYILLFEKSVEGLAGFDRPRWTAELKSILSSQAHLQTYQELLEKESTQTTIYQRYAGPKAAILSIFGNREVSVADLGCGLNLGLPGIEQNHPFMPIEDHSPSKKITSLVGESINLKNGISLDLVNPIKKKTWALACGFYPGELSNLPETGKLCDLLWSQTKTSFVQESLLNVSKIWKAKKLPKFDVAITSTVLYQLGDKDREKAMREIRKILKVGGVVIINDFVEVNHKISWSVDWFKKDSQSNYRTVVLQAIKGGFSQPMEFIVWNTGRCKVAYPGKDFKNVLELTK